MTSVEVSLTLWENLEHIENRQTQHSGVCRVASATNYPHSMWLADIFGLFTCLLIALSGTVWTSCEQF